MPKVKSDDNVDVVESQTLFDKALASAPLSGGAVVTAPVASDEPDPRFDAALNATPDWMSLAVQRQREANMNAAASQFVDNWLQSGHTIEDLKSYVAAL